MSGSFTPNYMFASYSDITPEFLESIGIRAILTDIDNTLAPYEQALPDARIKGWLSSLAERGISVALISNNESERVDAFNESLGLAAYAKSGKPLSKNLYAAMERLGTDESSTAMLGDQLLTDALAGNRIGLVTIIVPPINDKNNLFFRFKRGLEVGTVKRFVRAHGEAYRDICSFWLEKKYKRKNRSSET